LKLAYFGPLVLIDLGLQDGFKNMPAILDPLVQMDLGL
jgi:hypothetical protein